ncbi:MAG: hypothetical protein GXO87_09405 [Chlorobi bacterium]|nr:hypothetical protein [Chlorobiota bacterium]
MKKKLFKISIFFLLLSTVTLFAGAVLISFTAESDGENILLKWTTTNETNLHYFVVERKPVGGSFGLVSQPIQAKGDNSEYEFTDENAFKASDVLFIYRLKIVEVDNHASYSGEVSVSHSVSSVKRTWGSIKALFR